MRRLTHADMLQRARKDKMHQRWIVVDQITCEAAVTDDVTDDK